MKNLKLLLCLFALLGFVACGDDEAPTFALKDYPVSGCKEGKEHCDTLRYEVRDGKLNLDLCLKVPIDLTRVNYVVEFIPENNYVQLTIITCNDLDIEGICYMDFSYSIDKPFVSGETYRCKIAYREFIKGSTWLDDTLFEFDFTFTEGNNDIWYRPYS